MFQLNLPAQGVYPWQPLLRFFAQRELPGVEHVTDTSYSRAGLCATFNKEQNAWHVQAPDSAEARSRLTAMFDLEVNHNEIARHLKLSHAFLPGAWCPFEVAVRAILGQQISVSAARTLAGRLHTRTGITADGISNTPIDGLGILPSRARTLVALAKASHSQDFAYNREQLLAIPGIGPWTAEYIAMRTHRDPDAFPSSDLILRRAAVPGETLTARELTKHAERWRPFRAYAAIALWTGATASL